MKRFSIFYLSILISSVSASEVAVRSQELQKYDKALLVASSRNDYKTVESLINDGADVNTRDESDNTPLHCAAHNGHIESVRVLLGAHALVNELNIQGYSPAHLAHINGHRYIEGILIAQLEKLHIPYTLPPYINRMAVIRRVKRIREVLKTRCLGLNQEDLPLL